MFVGTLMMSWTMLCLPIYSEYKGHLSFNMTTHVPINKNYKRLSLGAQCQHIELARAIPIAIPYRTRMG